MKNVHKKVPSLILIIVLVGFPQISESIFTPVLPALSLGMQVSPATVQLTMSSYFVAFAFGVVFWGYWADRLGRRWAMLAGIGVYLLGNIGLFLAPNFHWLLAARLVQAFGASTGSVVTQTMMRESFEGVAGTQVFAKVSAAMALSPALGPFIGGLAQTYFGVRGVFGTLIGMATVILLYAGARLPETRPANLSVPSSSLGPLLKRLLTDRTVWVYGILIAGINGILFSYYAEAPFIFIEHFQLSPLLYGALGLVLAGASLGGALAVDFLVLHCSPVQVARLGLGVALVSSGFFLAMGVIDSLWGMIIGIFWVFLGLNVTLPIALNRALIGYEQVMGRASGLFSFGYYLLISGLTYLMSLLHTGAITQLPIFMVVVIAVMAGAYWRLNQH
ncbi:multidrug effflux MFS transporter [Lacticaseibacillus brantae]|uniref:Bcr/CflA family efflux transporter n=1 Tax=Lacticaseibacillus brantae DSM 23927 TaxID=1423727 RepID=A0A0R2AXN0_9LACO|nr:multidrug effflux MFS transporter [Lacticaseibacillus brantae]KRM72152.1 drug resistance transporter [Lacticaseibacillus brantae DSM 23927]